MGLSETAHQEIYFGNSRRFRNDDMGWTKHLYMNAYVLPTNAFNAPTPLGLAFSSANGFYHPLATIQEIELGEEEGRVLGV
jgi:hypothetical protein